MQTPKFQIFAPKCRPLQSAAPLGTAAHPRPLSHSHWIWPSRATFLRRTGVARKSQGSRTVGWNSQESHTGVSRSHGSRMDVVRESRGCMEVARKSHKSRALARKSEESRTGVARSHGSRTKVAWESHSRIEVAWKSYGSLAEVARKVAERSNRTRIAVMSQL